MSPLQGFWESKNSDTGVVTINITTINGTEASETINGSASNEIINGLGGNDILYGENGNDSLNGGNGNDYLDGFTSKTGSDLDTLTGGAGIDTFVLGNSRQGVFYVGNGQATITDYSSSDDYIQLRGGANDYQLNPQGSDTKKLNH
jgi:Ca2+-binding RTX toxin-like protein